MKVNKFKKICLLISIGKRHIILVVSYYFMSCKKDHHHEQKIKNNALKKNSDVVDRFLNVLWRREVDWKLTFK
tara:strand:- start:259 stop:477 length:219 start_codon:yes stop_codon:yes gene_type:complete